MTTRRASSGSRLTAALALLLSTGVLVASRDVAAEPRLARDTADVRPRGSWSVGVFNPLRISLSDRVELQAHPLAFFVAPHLDVRVALLAPPPTEPDAARAQPPALERYSNPYAMAPTAHEVAGAQPPAPELGSEAPLGAAPSPELRPRVPRGLRVTAEAGVALPTFGLRLTKGYLFPSWTEAKDDVGWMLVPRFALLASGTVREADVWTLRVDAALRAPLGRNSATRLDSFLTPLDLLLAAPLTGSLARVGGAYDAALGEVLRLRAELNLFVTGPSARVYAEGRDIGPAAALSPIVVTAHLGLDVAVFAQSRLTVGALYANVDQGRTVVVTAADGFSDRRPARSVNILPTVDFIWEG